MKIFGEKEDKIIKSFQASEIKFAVYGLGKMGLPLAAIIAEKGGKVIGVDVDKTTVESINKGECHVYGEPGLAEMVARNVKNGRLTATTDLVRAAQEADVMIIIVPVFLDSDKKADLSIITSVSKSIAKGMKPGDFVITECTLPPRTTKDVILPILLESGLKQGQFGLAHCPERVSSGRTIQDITEAYPKVVGGIDEKSAETAVGIYRVINTNGVIKVSDATTAEAVKVFEGVYRDVNIALANELVKACDEIGIDAIEAFTVANTQPYSHIHMPGPGVGGHCIPVYPYFITENVKSDTSLLKLARKINDEMPQYTVNLLKRGLNKAGLTLESSSILVLGVTFRGDVKETRCSPAQSIIDILKKGGAQVFAYDPLLEKEVEQMGAIPHGIDDFSDIDAIIVAADYKEFKNIDWTSIQMRHKILIDGKRTISPSVREHGFIFYGIGVK